MSQREKVTTLGVRENLPTSRSVRCFQLEVTEGLEKTSFKSTGLRCQVGSHASNDFVLEDPTVSRFHCELSMEERGLRVRDLGSTNGTWVGDLELTDALLPTGAKLRLGKTALIARYGDERGSMPLSEQAAFGELVGASDAMRSTFSVLERAAATDFTVLIEGETGTGKGSAAEAIHDASARRSGPFVVVDCGAVSAQLLEDELFGHERGAFTGAVSPRAGAFEVAAGGTVFLDEIGELALELQPKLLRALERREIRRIGGSAHLPVDVRVVAATNRELRERVNGGTFRPDLYFRLAVLQVVMPSLRARKEDLPLLVQALLPQVTRKPSEAAALLAPEFLAGLAESNWPGNVRELRNYLQRCVALPETAEGTTPDDRLPLADARARAARNFERQYLKALLEQHDGIAAAARAAGVARAYLYRLIRRHGLKPPG